MRKWRCEHSEHVQRLCKKTCDRCSDGDDEDENTQITATQLDVEILPTFQGKETIGGIMQASEQTGPVTSDGYKKGGGPKINEEKFLEDFRREAGPLRGDTSVGQ